jgi:hypothetical protein
MIVVRVVDVLARHQGLMTLPSFPPPPCVGDAPSLTRIPFASKPFVVVTVREIVHALSLVQDRACRVYRRAAAETSARARAARTAAASALMS